MFGKNEAIQEKFVCCILALNEISDLITQEKKNFDIKQKVGHKWGGSASLVLEQIASALDEIGKETGILKE